MRKRYIGEVKRVCCSMSSAWPWWTSGKFCKLTPSTALPAARLPSASARFMSTMSVTRRSMQTCSRGLLNTMLRYYTSQKDKWQIHSLMLPFYECSIRKWLILYLNKQCSWLYATKLISFKKTNTAERT